MLSKNLALFGVAVASALGQPSHAGTTRYYYDSVGRLLGETNTQALDRTTKADNADNLTYLHVLPTVTATAVNILGPGGVLVADQSLTSTDGRYGLAVQDDGNLVIYGPSSCVAWTSGTSGHQPGYLTMQTAGNLVFYGPDDSVIWASNGTLGSNASVSLSTSGVLTISEGSTILWSSGAARC